MSLAFPPYEFRTRIRGGRDEIWDELRGIWLLLTPEEGVRRHLVRYLAEELGADKGRIVQEYPFKLGRKAFRADVVCFDATLRPLLLAECKAPSVAIHDGQTLARTLAQAVKYNSVVGARYIVLTNGERHYALERDPSAPGGYRQLKELPDLRQTGEHT